MSSDSPPDIDNVGEQTSSVIRSVDDDRPENSSDRTTNSNDNQLPNQPTVSPAAVPIVDDCVAKLLLDGKIKQAAQKRQAPHLDFFQLMQDASDAKRRACGEAEQPSTSSLTAAKGSGVSGGSGGSFGSGGSGGSAGSILSTVVSMSSAQFRSPPPLLPQVPQPPQLQPQVGAVFMSGDDDLDMDEPCTSEAGGGGNNPDHRKNVIYANSLDDDMRRFVKSNEAHNYEEVLALRITAIARHAHASLNEYGWAVVDNLLGGRHANALAQETATMFTKETFVEGQLMGLQPERSDRIYWFDNRNPSSADYSNARLIMGVLDAIVTHMSLAVSGRSKAFISMYARNSHHGRHSDNDCDDGRLLTLTYMPSVGDNALRLYPKTSHIPIDIDTKSDRLVMHWSDARVPHEVLTVGRPHMNITVWYFDKNHSNRESIKRATSEAFTKQTPLTLKAHANTASHSSGAVSQLRDLHLSMGHPSSSAFVRPELLPSTLNNLGSQALIQQIVEQMSGGHDLLGANNLLQRQLILQAMLRNQRGNQ